MVSSALVFSRFVLYNAGTMNTVRKLWENSNISAICPRSAHTVLFDEPMSAHTTFKLGGPADVYIEPPVVEELCALIDYCFTQGVPVYIVGAGSNILVSDQGIRGVVLSLSGLQGTELMSDTDRLLVRSLAGTPVDELSAWCCAQSLAGLERFAGLPGTVGGAVFMNARCYDLSISDRFFSADILYFTGGRCTLSTMAFTPGEWEYKKSPFQSGRGEDPLLITRDSRIVVAATFRVERSLSASLEADRLSFIEDRKKKGHFRYPSAGSMFKNSRAFGKPSGQIIDEAGLRGFTIGGAQVAPWHGNFVINTGDARASDVRRLVSEVQRQVLEKTGFLLEPEVVFTGEWSDLT